MCLQIRIEFFNHLFRVVGPCQNIFSLAQWHHSLWSCAKISSKLNLFVIPTILYHSSRLKGVSPLWWSKTMYSICRRYNCYHWRRCMGDDPWLTDFDQHLTKIVRYTVSGGASSLAGTSLYFHIPGSQHRCLAIFVGFSPVLVAIADLSVRLPLIPTHILFFFFVLQERSDC